MDFVTWLTDQTERIDVVGLLADDVVASGLTFTNNSVDDVLRAGFDPAATSVADQEYRRDHMRNPDYEELHGNG